MAKIELKNISKQFGKGKRMAEPEAGPAPPLSSVIERPEAEMGGERREPFAIKDLNLTIPDGRVMVILGPSGCGKSTLLHLMAGLTEPDAGDIYYNGVNMTETPPGDRKIGMVFQNYALYPQYSSRQNILSYFSFRKRTPELDKEAEEKYRRTSELMGVELKHLLNKKPGRLSGGEQQRVAIARCITRDPVLFLMDEPFSNLDAKLRVKYRTRLKRLLKQFNITTVYVTHDQQEALVLADLIAIMNVGRIEQVGPPRQLYDHPNNIFVADFLNFDQETVAVNLIDGHLAAAELSNTILGVRPEDVAVCPAGTARALTGAVVDVRSIPIKEDMVLTLDLAGAKIQFRLPLNHDLANQSQLSIRLKKYHVFDKNTGRRIRTHSEDE